MDLEPEGKVFVVITLTGSFTEGKGVTLACSHSELTLVCVPPSVPEQGRCLDSSRADVAEVSGVMGKSGRGCGWQLGLCVLSAQGAGCSLWFIFLKLSFRQIVFVTPAFHLASC